MRTLFGKAYLCAMNLDRLKKIWKVVKVLWVSAICFWVLETIFFLVVYGWHNEYELTCDFIVRIVLNIGFGLFIYILYEIIEWLSKHTSNGL